MKNILAIQKLKVKVENKEIIKGFSLVVKEGETHALMGPNGSGKSTLALALMGHPRYQVKSGKVLINNQNLLKFSSEKRAQKGLFLSFQYPFEIPGVNFLSFLRLAYNQLKRPKNNPISVREFKALVEEKIKILKLNPLLLERAVNEGFSGGEKKKAEILQLAVLEPKFAILDETDSGLDVDALRNVVQGIKQIRKKKPMGVILITHYPRILKFIKPDYVHILLRGKIVASGKEKLAKEVERKGYGWLESEKRKNKSLKN